MAQLLSVYQLGLGESGGRGLDTGTLPLNQLLEGSGVGERGKRACGDSRIGSGGPRRTIFGWRWGFFLPGRVWPNQTQLHPTATVSSAHIQPPHWDLRFILQRIHNCPQATGGTPALLALGERWHQPGWNPHLPGDASGE